MTRTQLKFTILAGALALPGLTSCVPVMLAGQASSMFNHPTAPTPTPANDGTILSMHPATQADREASNSHPSGGTGNAAGGMAAGLGGGAGGGNSWSSMLVSGLGGGAFSSVMGTPTPAPTPTPRGPATAFTVRMDDGSTQLVVQNGDLGLHPGDRVQVISRDRTRLVRAG
jgi:outer membrane lipoprotein SlyB